MKQNMANWDRIGRAVIAVILFALILTNALAGTWAIVAGVVGVIFGLTAIVGTCPLYMLLKFSTK